MYTITKEFHFSASHQLDGLPETHPCSRMHGHNYVLKVELKSKDLNQVGFVKDYRELDEIKQFIDSNLDHRHLNDVFSHNPTAEEMAKTLFNTFKPGHSELSAIEISETDKTNCRYEPDFD